MKKIKEIIILLVILLAILQVYLYTAFPAYKNDDSPETITSVYTLGIGHPPGYPFFTLAGKAFSLLPIGSPAFRVNSFSIFLAMLVLFLSYFLIKRNTVIVFGEENKLVSIAGVLILASSYIFWNQAIEAKGGIYIMNLVFLAILIYLSLETFTKFSLQNFYLISYIYGLSLANHWPSVIILLPVFAYLFFKHRKNFGLKKTAISILLLAAGLSPYLYLPVRGNARDIFVFMANPDTWENFWWTVLRTAYINVPKPSADIYLSQAKEFFTLLLSNFSFLWVLVFFGCYIIFKNKKEQAFFYSAAFLIIASVVVLYNRSTKEAMWSEDIFLMPAQYILLVFMGAGACFILGSLHKSIYRLAFISAVACIMLYSGIRHFNINNSRENYIAYDFTDNVFKTMEPGSIYVPINDYYEMPIGYMQMVSHGTNGVDVYPGYFYLLKMTVIKAKKNLIKTNDLAATLNDIVEEQIHRNNIYFSEYFPELFKDNPKNYQIMAKGLVFKVTQENEPAPSADVFRTYSYRGIFDVKTDYDKSLILIYSANINNQAYGFFAEKKYREAEKTYKYALMFPENQLRAGICFHLAMVYNKMQDDGNEVKYLEETIKTDKNYYNAYDVLGSIYYDEKLWLPAREMYEKAINYGSTNKGALQVRINAMGKLDVYTECKSLAGRADAFMASGKYFRAIDLYGFLLEHGFATAAIYLNLAESYYHLQDEQGALDTLKKGMQDFKNDSGLIDLFNRIKGKKGHVL